MKLNDNIENAKRKLANQLTKATEQFSTKTKKRGLAIIGLVCAFLCIWLTSVPFIHKRTSSPVNATIPVVIHPTSTDPLLTKEEYQMLEGFLTTMDSLKQVYKKAYENAMAGREGLIDSILFLLKHSGEYLTK